MTVPNDAIQEVAGMLYSAGVVCNFGVDESLLPAMIDMAQTRYPNKVIRAVKNWMWWDFEVSGGDSRSLSGALRKLLFYHA